MFVDSSVDVFPDTDIKVIRVVFPYTRDWLNRYPMPFAIDAKKGVFVVFPYAMFAHAKSKKVLDDMVIDAVRHSGWSYMFNKTHVKYINEWIDRALSENAVLVYEHDTEPIILFPIPYAE